MQTVQIQFRCHIFQHLNWVYTVYKESLKFSYSVIIQHHPNEMVSTIAWLICRLRMLSTFVTAVLLYFFSPVFIQLCRKSNSTNTQLQPILMWMTSTQLLNPSRNCLMLYCVGKEQRKSELLLILFVQWNIALMMWRKEFVCRFHSLTVTPDQSEFKLMEIFELNVLNSK